MPLPITIEIKNAVALFKYPTAIRAKPRVAIVPRQRSVIKQQRQRHQDGGDHGRHRHSANDRVLLDHHGGDVPGCADANAGRRNGQGGGDGSLHAIEHAPRPHRVRGGERGADDDQLRALVLRQQRRRRPGACLGLVHARAQLVQPIARRRPALPALGRLIGQIDEQWVRLDDATPELVAHAFQLVDGRVLISVPPDVPAQAAVVRDDAGDQRGIQRAKTRDERFRRRRARRRIVGRDPDQQVAQCLSAPLDLLQIAHRSRPRWQQVRQVGLNRQAGRQHAAAHGHRDAGQQDRQRPANRIGQHRFRHGDPPAATPPPPLARPPSRAPPCRPAGSR